MAVGAAGHDRVVKRRVALLVQAGHRRAVVDQRVEKQRAAFLRGGVDQVGAVRSVDLAGAVSEQEIQGRLVLRLDDLEQVRIPETLGEDVGVGALLRGAEQRLQRPNPGAGLLEDLVEPLVVALVALHLHDEVDVLAPDQRAGEVDLVRLHPLVQVLAEPSFHPDERVHHGAVPGGLRRHHQRPLALGEELRAVAIADEALEAGDLDVEVVLARAGRGLREHHAAEEPIERGASVGGHQHLRGRVEADRLDAAVFHRLVGAGAPLTDVVDANLDSRHLPVGPVELHATHTDIEGVSIPTTGDRRFLTRPSARGAATRAVATRRRSPCW